MIEALKDDKIMTKVGGRFKFAALVQHRIRELMDGSRPLVDRDGRSDFEVAVQEIVEEKIALRDIDDFDETDHSDDVDLDTPVEIETAEALTSMDEVDAIIAGEPEAEVTGADALMAAIADIEIPADKPAVTEAVKEAVVEDTVAAEEIAPVEDVAPVEEAAPAEEAGEDKPAE